MNKTVLMVLSCSLFVLFIGCKRDSVAEREQHERSDALFAEAMAAEARGDTRGAETLYRQLLARDAAMASAHLNIAILLHDVRKDYIEAIYHYRTYLALQPKSEKSAMVNERIASAKGLLATQLAAEIIAREQAVLMRERDSQEKQLALLEQKYSALQEENTKKEAALSDLKAQLNHLRALIKDIKDVESAQSPTSPNEIKQLKESIVSIPKKDSESDVETVIHSVREDAKRMIEMPDGGQQARNEATRKVIANTVAVPPIASNPIPGQRYLVRPGDTFSKLSREAYGNTASWIRIRDANRSTSNPDGRLRAGEIIVIP